MASTARSLQLGMRRCCAAATTAAARSSTRCLASSARRPAQSSSSSSSSSGPKKDHLEPWEVEMQAKELASSRVTSFRQAMAAETGGAAEDGAGAAKGGERPAGADALTEQQEERLLGHARSDMFLYRRNVRKTRGMFWSDEEADPEMIMKESAEDEADTEDMTSLAHAKLDEIRERRHYARIAAWEMPLLAQFAKPFEPPAADMPLRFRFTSYLGEFHPAEKKVVVEFCPADLDLTEVQQRKLAKLAGARYNPETEIVRMSCESFEHQAQNKRYLGDLVAKLIAEARVGGLAPGLAIVRYNKKLTPQDPADTFEDIPLDTRHHTFKTKPRFPKAWRMTEARRAELQALRAQSFRLDQAKAAEGTLVDGAQRVRAALAEPAPAAADEVAELVRVRPRAGPQLRR